MEQLFSDRNDFIRAARRDLDNAVDLLHDAALVLPKDHELYERLIEIKRELMLLESGVYLSIENEHSVLLDEE